MATWLEGSLKHLIYACIYRSALKFGKKHVLIVVISSKMHCNAENACTNGKWQHAAQMKLYPLTLSTERDRERECPKHTRLSTSYLNWHRCWVWRATALNTNKKKLNERNYEKNEKIRHSVVFVEKMDLTSRNVQKRMNNVLKSFDDLQKWQSM